MQPLLSDAGKAQAEEQVRTYAIDAGPLGAVLGRFSNEAGVLLSFDAALTNGKHSPGLQGSYSVEQGFAQLLAGSGLQAVATGAGSFGIKPGSYADDVLELSPMSISGKAPGSITEGTGSYTTYSTSSSTRLNLSPKETPQSIAVLTRQRMDDQRLTNLVEALDATPGVTVKPLGLGADSPQIWARGSSIRTFQIDGVPTSSSLSNYLQSTAMLDRIEIVRGATGMMSGLGTPSATINMIRKRPTYEAQAILSAEAGSWQRYGTQVDVSGPLTTSGNVRARAVVDYKQQGAWTDNYQQDYFTLYGITEFDLGDSSLLTLGFSHITRNSDSPVRSSPMFYSNGQRIHFDPEDNDTPSWQYYDHSLSSVFASIEHSFMSGWNAKAEFSHTEYSYDSIVGNLMGNIDQATQTGSFVRPVHWASDVSQDSLDAYMSGPYSLFGREHELIAGVTLSQLQSSGPGYSLRSVISVPDASNWVDDTPGPSFNRSGKSTSHEYQYGAYLSTRLNLTDATSLLLGGRVTNWKQNNDSTSYTTGIKSKEGSRESGIFVPYAGLVHALNETWSVYASYTQIFQPQDSFVQDYIDSPEPEEGTSYEAGIKGSFNDGRLNSNLSVFRTEQDSLAVWDSIERTYDLFNDTITEGVELELNGELAPGWNFGSGYVYSVTENKDGERILTRAPRHSIKTFTTYRLPGSLNKWTVGGGFNWESKTGDDLHVFTQKSYALANLMARYDINEKLSASVNINNLFDKKYFMGVAGNGVYGAPRNVMTSLSYTY
ncbi:MAG: TonB-dependent siderophore receptor [Pseudomonas sp.]